MEKRHYYATGDEFTGIFPKDQTYGFSNTDIVLKFPIRKAREYYLEETKLLKAHTTKPNRKAVLVGFREAYIRNQHKNKMVEGLEMVCDPFADIPMTDETFFKYLYHRGEIKNLCRIFDLQWISDDDLVMMNDTEKAEAINHLVFHLGSDWFVSKKYSVPRHHPSIY